jgi:hypothetical protein
VNVYIRRFDTQEIVKIIDVRSPTPIQHGRFMLGLLRNMDTVNFYADDSEVTYPEAEPEVTA